MRPQNGEVIQGKYRILRPIGDGGMGSIYEARHEMLGSSVALKFLHDDLAARPGFLSRFIQEARVSATLHSPHIVRVLDVERVGNTAFLVMELLVGETLQDAIEREGSLEVGSALRVGLQMLTGLEVAHQAGVIHRDLKPENVYLANQSRGVVVKILDFGIAKLRVGPSRPGLTRPGITMGTPEYMAPEQAFSADTVDPRADIYAVGMLLFELLAGRRPLGGDDPRAIARAVLAGQGAHLGQLVPGLDPRLVQVVHKSLAPLPEQRFSTAVEMRDALLPFLPQKPEATAAPPAAGVVAAPPAASPSGSFGGEQGATTERRPPHSLYDTSTPRTPHQQAAKPAQQPAGQHRPHGAPQPQQPLHGLGQPQQPLPAHGPTAHAQPPGHAHGPAAHAQPPAQHPGPAQAAGQPRPVPGTPDQTPFRQPAPGPQGAPPPAQPAPHAAPAQPLRAQPQPLANAQQPAPIGATEAQAPFADAGTQQGGPSPGAWQGGAPAEQGRTEAAALPYGGPAEGTPAPLPHGQDMPPPRPGMGSGGPAMAPALPPGAEKSGGGRSKSKTGLLALLAMLAGGILVVLGLLIYRNVADEDEGEGGDKPASDSPAPSVTLSTPEPSTPPDPTTTSTATPPPPATATTKTKPPSGGPPPKRPPGTGAGGAKGAGGSGAGGSGAAGASGAAGGANGSAGSGASLPDVLDGGLPPLPSALPTTIPVPPIPGLGNLAAPHSSECERQDTAGHRGHGLKRQQARRSALSEGRSGWPNGPQRNFWP